MQQATIAIDTTTLSATRADGCGPIDCPTVAPEPATFVLLAVPVLFVAVLLWRRRRSTAS